MTDTEKLAIAVEALELACGNRCDAHYNPCNAREALESIAKPDDTKAVSSEKAREFWVLEAKADKDRLCCDYEPEADAGEVFIHVREVIETPQRSHEPG